MGLNPGAVYWMDIFSHVFAVKYVFEKTENKRKKAHFYQTKSNIVLET